MPQQTAPQDLAAEVAASGSQPNPIITRVLMIARSDVRIALKELNTAIESEALRAGSIDQAVARLEFALGNLKQAKGGV